MTQYKRMNHFLVYFGTIGRNNFLLYFVTIGRNKHHPMNLLNPYLLFLTVDAWSVGATWRS